MSILSKPYFHDEAAAFEHLEAALWPEGPVCPHCGGMGRIGKVKANPAKRVRMGLHRCGDCGKQFTVKVGTVFEHGRIPLHKMLQAVHLMVASKKGVSAHQLHRILEVQYRTAWFLAHRIREAMRSGEFAPMGGLGGIVEIDETFIGNDRTVKPHGEKKGRGYAHKHKVLALVDRKAGTARTMVVDDLKASTLTPILSENIDREARVFTDEAGQYTKLGDSFAEHDFVRHGAEEWARGEVHTNTLEGFFSIFKRGMKGIYQHCAKKHLHRYAAEFEFRYNNRVALGIDDPRRASRVLEGIKGKRLTYKEPTQRSS
jgi:transposase-like protein